MFVLMSASGCRSGCCRSLLFLKCAFATCCRRLVICDVGSVFPRPHWKNKRSVALARIRTHGSNEVVLKPVLQSNTDNKKGPSFIRRVRLLSHLRRSKTIQLPRRHVKTIHDTTSECTYVVDACEPFLVKPLGGKSDCSSLTSISNATATCCYLKIEAYVPGGTRAAP